MCPSCEHVHQKEALGSSLEGGAGTAALLAVGELSCPSPSRAGGGEKHWGLKSGAALCLPSI